MNPYERKMLVDMLRSIADMVESSELSPNEVIDHLDGVKIFAIASTREREQDG